MKNLAGVTAFSLLLALLTWLLLRGVDTNAPAYAITLRAFDDYALAEASLHRDVLQARAGLLRDYDSFVTAVRAMQDAVGVLRTHARMENLDAGPVDRLAAAVARQEELMERFKTSNALLQNSLSYVGLMSTSPAFHAEDARLASATDALAAAVLYLSRDTSTDALAALQERIDRFVDHAPTDNPDADVARAMLAHARLLYQELPAVDATLKAFIAVPSREALEETRAMFSVQRAKVAAVEQRFRLLLYLVSLVLLIVLVLLGVRLRTRAVALRRRAAFEHVIAENSTRLINCSPLEMEARLEQVLGEFARAIGADRAYVVLDEKPVRSHVWSAEAGRCPPGWPELALTLSAPLVGDDTENVAVPDVAALPPGPLRNALDAAGVRAWVCLPLSRPGGVRSVMGFDAFRPACNSIFPLSIVRLAGDAVANALERDVLERERAKLTLRLERARRMQMVGLLASGIAHNFNNIITAIVGYSEMVEPQIARGTKAARHVEEIRRAAARGRDLVDNILSFGRRTDTRVRTVQVRSLLEEATALLRVSLPADVALILEDVSPDIAVSGEPAQLQQIILNLCSNAVQAMDGRGSIRVSASREELAAPRRLSDGELPPGGFARIAVIDDGRGFDAHVARRLFEPFFTTRLAGTGLGLATVREIVGDHEGAIHVHSTPGHGSRFEVWLPASAAGSSPAPGRPSALRLGDGETVLIVENERERLTRDEEELAALGYEPIGFERPADALAACRSQPERFDIILITLGSQTRGGLDLARALHEIVPLKPVLLAAASSSDVNVNAMAEAGVSELLRWPLVSSELAAALARGLHAPAPLRS
jgi:signal transduction histidine kinase